MGVKISLVRCQTEPAGGNGRRRRTLAGWGRREWNQIRILEAAGPAGGCRRAVTACEASSVSFILVALSPCVELNTQLSTGGCRSIKVMILLFSFFSCVSPSPISAADNRMHATGLILAVAVLLAAAAGHAAAADSGNALLPYLD